MVGKSFLLMAGSAFIATASPAKADEPLFGYVYTEDQREQGWRAMSLAYLYRQTAVAWDK